MNISFRHRLATYMGYIILGLSFGLWAMLIPFIKDSLNINKAELGVLLLQIAFGSVVSMFFTGFITSKIGCKKSVIISTLLIILCFLIISLSTNMFIAAIFMFLLGAGFGMLDVTVNIQGVFVEESLKKHLMAGFHSMYSFGVFFGVLLASLLLKYYDFLPAVLIFTSCLFLLLIINIPFFLKYGGDAPKKILIKPTRILFVLGVVCFIAFVVEGIVLDWSALFMREVKKVATEYVGYSFSLFYLTMGIIRLLGDKIAERYSSQNILFISSLIAIGGMMTMLYIPYVWATYIGFTLAGAGLANLVPVTISASGKYKGNMPVNIAVSAVATIGYFGTLFGPSIMGFVSEMTNLRVAFTIITCTLLFITLLSKSLK